MRGHAEIGDFARVPRAPRNGISIFNFHFTIQIPPPGFGQSGKYRREQRPRRAINMCRFGLTMRLFAADARLAAGAKFRRFHIGIRRKIRAY
jgi:hypothetical protein